MNPGDFKRLRDMGVATVYEASGREGLLDVALIQLLPGSRIVGPARTVLCGQDDNLMVHASIEHIQPGDILVLTMPEPAPVALIGDLLVTQIKARQAAGILVDAAVRDSEDLVKLGLPIWTRYIRVRGATKTMVGELNVTVHVGGAKIAPADILVLDADGGVCVRQARVGEVLQAAEARLAREAAMRKQLIAGAMSYNIHGLRDIVEREEKQT